MFYLGRSSVHARAREPISKDVGETRSKMNHVIYIDESGYTGADYVNPDQPVFSLACNLFTAENFERIASGVFAGDRGAELKFSRLVGRESGRKKLHAFIDFLGEHPDQFCCYVADKWSALVRDFVADCIHPVLLLDDGVNLLEDGWCLAYANLLSFNLPAIMGADWFETFLRYYNKFIRSPDEDSLQSLWQHCMQAMNRDSAGELLSPFLNRPQLALLKLTLHQNNRIFYESILATLLIHLRTYYGINRATVVYDQTKATTDYNLKEFIDDISNLGQTFRVSDVSIVNGDLSVSAVSAASSIEHYGVQVSDIIAGLFNYSFRAKETIKSDLSKHLREIITEKNFIHLFNSTAVTPEELGLKGSQASMLFEALQLRKKTKGELKGQNHIQHKLENAKWIHISFQELVSWLREERTERYEDDLSQLEEGDPGFNPDDDIPF